RIMSLGRLVDLIRRITKGEAPMKLRSLFPRVTIGLGLIADAVIASPALAQVPVITAVVNDAGGGPKLSPGVPVRIYFQPLDSGRNSLVVEVGGRQIPAIIPTVVPGGPVAYSTAVLPPDLPLGPTSLTITTSNGTSTPFALNLDAVSPGLSSPS